MGRTRRNFRWDSRTLGVSTHGGCRPGSFRGQNTGNSDKDGLTNFLGIGDCLRADNSSDDGSGRRQRERSPLPIRRDVFLMCPCARSYMEGLIPLLDRLVADPDTAGRISTVVPGRLYSCAGECSPSVPSKSQDGQGNMILKNVRVLALLSNFGP